MNFEIREENTIAEVQTLFNTCFPYLKIDFFEKNVSFFPSIVSYKPMLHTERKLIEFRKDSKKIAPFQVTKELNVTAVEKFMQSFYSIYAQVYRKSGNVWLETTVTGNWSLEEQNKQGRSITLQIQENRPLK